MIDKSLVCTLFKSGITQAKISHQLNVHQSSIRKILIKFGLKPKREWRLSQNLKGEIQIKYDNGYSVKELQDFYKLSRQVIESALEKLRYPNDSNHLIMKRHAVELTEQQRQMLLGTLLGDGSISKIGDRNRSYRIQITHGLKQLEYSQYKQKILGINKTHIYKCNSAFAKDRKTVKIGYTNISASEYLKERVLVDGKKRINPRWLQDLNMEGIAYWFMDDGSSVFYRNRHVTVHFYTNGYDIEECTLLQKKLASLGFLVSITGQKGKFRVMNGERIFSMKSLVL